MMLIILTVFLVNSVLAQSNHTGGVLRRGRIYLGAEASMGQIPYQALLEITSRRGQFLCGGSLIHPQWVLTAAHCTVGASNVQITLGEVNRSVRSRQGVVRVSSRQIYNHPGYNSRTIANDISLVRLPSTPSLNGRVGVVSLPSRQLAAQDALLGQKVVISGWGSTSNAMRSSNGLKYGTTAVISMRACRKAYPTSRRSRSEKVKDHMVCTKTNRRENMSGTCSGDSGGPLVWRSGGRDLVVGITSWGVAQCQTDKPSVYTSVPHFLSFIYSMTNMTVQ